MARAPAGGLAAETAITRLIQGVYEREPEQARRILRCRIFSSAAGDEMSLGMVRVAAKRMSSGALPPAAASEIAEAALPGADTCGLGAPLGFADPMQTALRLAAQVPVQAERYASPRRVAAILVSTQGEPLAWAINSNARDKTRHAEINLVQRYCREHPEGLPAGATLYTTLKPCKMCAGMIWRAGTWGGRPFGLNILYAEDDPGPQARATALEGIARKLVT